MSDKGLKKQRRPPDTLAEEVSHEGKVFPGEELQCPRRGILVKTSIFPSLFFEVFGDVRITSPLPLFFL